MLSGNGITSFNKANGAIFSAKIVLKHSGVSNTQKKSLYQL